MNTHETYVSLETARLLKEAGFNWECQSAYTGDGFKDIIMDTCDWDYGYIDWNNITNARLRVMGAVMFQNAISAPSLSIAQRWLREVKHIDAFAYRNEPKDKFESIVSTNTSWENTDKSYDTYESALEAGIKKCLTLLLKEE